MPRNSIVGSLNNETGYAIITVNLASGNSSNSRRLNGKKALIDTGATNSAITEELITELRLDKLGTQDSHSFDRLIPDVPYYAGHIEIPELSQGWNLRSIQPTSGSPGLYDAVIGNDILASCTLMMIGPVNKFSLMNGTPPRLIT